MKLLDTFSTINKITAFALPISTSMLINTLSSFVAMIFVARLGKLELAAGALASSTFLVVMTVVSTVFYAIGILISHAKGQDKTTHSLGELVKAGFWLAVILFIPSGIALSNADKILFLFKQDPQLILLTKSYFFYAALTMLPTLVGNVLIQFFIGIGRPRFMLFVSLLSLPVNLLISYGFILGKFGLPQLALAGITCTSFITQSLVCLSILVYLFCKKEFSSYDIFTGSLKPDWLLCKAIFTLGLPIGIQFGAELAAIAVSTYFMGYFGATALAASQIVTQYAILAVMVTLGLSQGIGVLTSEAYGQQNLNLVKQYIYSALLVLSVFFTLLFSIFLFLPHLLISAFIANNNANNADLIHLTVMLFAIAGFIQLADGVRNLLSGTLRGLQEAKAPMQIGVSCLWLLSIPLSYIVGFHLTHSPVGLRLGFLTGFIVAAFLLWKKTQEKLNSIEETGNWGQTSMALP